MKKISLFLGAALMALVVASCGSSKDVVTETANPSIQTLPDEPCSEFMSTSDIFRATGQHIAKGDRQMQFAYDQAAIAARNENGEVEKPISPCGACRQVMLETEMRFSRPMRIILYGAQECYIIEGGTKELMPLSFSSDFLK